MQREFFLVRRNMVLKLFFCFFGALRFKNDFISDIA